MRKKSTRTSSAKKPRRRTKTAATAMRSTLASAAEPVVDIYDTAQIVQRVIDEQPDDKSYVIGPSQDYNYPDISALEKWKFTDTVDVFLPPVIESVLSSTRYAKQYSISANGSLKLEKTLAPLKMTVGNSSSLEPRHKEHLDFVLKTDKCSDLRFIADDNMTALSSQIKGCGLPLEPTDGVPMKMLSVYLRECALNAKAVEKYTKQLEIRYPDYINAGSTLTPGQPSQANFIKWGSFCLSDQFDLQSDEMKSMMNADGTVTLSAISFEPHQPDAFYGTRDAYLYIYECTNETSAISSEGHPEWQYFKNQPKQYDRPLYSSDNCFSNETYSDELSVYKYIFRSQLPRLDVNKDYVFKIADASRRNNLELPLRSDFSDEEAPLYGPPFQLSTDPCISLRAVVTGNQKDFLFYNAIVNNEYVHIWDPNAANSDHPLGKQVYIKSIDGVYVNKPDNTTTISADYLLLQDRKAVDPKTGEKKIWKLTLKKNQAGDEVVIDLEDLGAEKIPDPETEDSSKPDSEGTDTAQG